MSRQKVSARRTGEATQQYRLLYLRQPLLQRTPSLYLYLYLGQ
ncbi:hypothetical protein [Pontibacter indicus]|nr:hypothetical protein [Pontibacter indicus]